MAGFSKSCASIGAQQLKDTLEDHPKIAEVFEQRCFEKLLQSIKDRSLEIDYLFQRMDLDNDNRITPEELWLGFEALRVLLNKKDKHLIWKIIDVDGNGSVTCDEIAEICRMYEQRTPEFADIRFAERLGAGRDEFE